MTNTKYNTEESPLILREYGRNIQRMIEFAVTIEDDEKRNIAVQEIINMMGQMNPHLRNVEQFRHKLWDHLFVMSEFKLKADSPYPVPNKEDVELDPLTLGYPQEDLKFRHYGKNVETLVKKAIAMEDPAKKLEFAKVIANYMKMVYRDRNNDSVRDDIIIRDLQFLSDGQLDLGDDPNLDTLTKSNARKRYKKPSNNNNHKNNNNRHQNNRNRRRK